jgi:hypothetical protein
MRYLRRTHAADMYTCSTAWMPTLQVLLRIIGDFPKGAELLLLAFVRTLTESGGCRCGRVSMCVCVCVCVCARARRGGSDADSPGQN